MTSMLAHRHRGERSFERLYRAYVQDVYRYSLMLLRNRADAEDAAQTTFMKAYRAIQRGDQPRHPRRWLITIAHNTCRTHARDDSRRPREVAFEDALPEPAAPPAEPDVDVSELVQALGALSFNQRAALVLREFEGRSYAEIAEVLEISGSAVETLLFRARRALREQLEGALTCGEAEYALSLQLDGRLGREGRPRLRAHLRECGECAALARRQRARRAALRSLGPLPLPSSIVSWGGAGAGSGVAVKVAAVLAAGIAAAGASQDGARAVTDVALPPPPALVEPVAPAPTPRGRVAEAPDLERRPVAVAAARPAPSGPRTTAPPTEPPVRPSAPAPSPPAERTPSPPPPAPEPKPLAEVETPTVTIAVVEVVAVTLPSTHVAVEAPELPAVELPALP